MNKIVTFQLVVHTSDKPEEIFVL